MHWEAFGWVFGIGACQGSHKQTNSCTVAAAAVRSLEVTSVEKLEILTPAGLGSKELSSIRGVVLKTE